MMGRAETMIAACAQGQRLTRWIQWEDQGSSGERRHCWTRLQSGGQAGKGKEVKDLQREGRTSGVEDTMKKTEKGQKWNSIMFWPKRSVELEFLELVRK